MKTFIIEYPALYWECKVKIDEEKAKEPIKEMVEFWMEWQYRLEMNDGDYTNTFLQQLAKRILFIVISEGYNLQGVKSEFDRGLEGWCKMDGSCGIEIIRVDDVEFLNDDFEIEEIEKGGLSWYDVEELACQKRSIHD